MTDFRFVLRILRRSPAFFVVATATLGLGIAANTAMFSLFYQVLLRTLPVPDPQSLVVFHSDPPNLPGGVSSDNGETVFSYPMYQRLRDGLHAFQGVAARSGDSVQIGVDGAADRGRAEFVSGNFFDALRVRSQIGRLLTPSDDTAPGANTVAVISHDFWERRFGLHASALNRTILLNGHAFTIVGVAQAGFRGVLAGDTPDLFVPISAKLLLAPNWTSYDKPDMQWLTVLGRLAPEMSRERASAELQPVFAAVMRDHIQQAGVKGQSVRSRLLAKHAELRPAAQGLNQLEQQWKNPLFVLLGMASLLLLIACANLANLLAARATNRAREIGVRIALGATRGRIVRLLLIESGVLALTGTVLGIAFAPVLNRMLLQFLPEDELGGWVSNALNLPVLVFSAGLMIVVAALCGVVPAIQATRSGLPPLGERGSSAGRASAGTRKLLVAGQIALSLVLLACAGLFSRSLWNLVGNNFGFRAERVLTFSVNAGMNGYDVDRGLNFYHDLLRRLKDLPGVDSVSMADAGPLSHSTHTSNVSIEGYTTKDGEEMDSVVISVAARYFRTLGTPLLSGREFDEREGHTAPKAAVINDAFVRRFFGRQPPLGRHMSIGAGVPLDIVITGVVSDVRNSSLRDPAKPTLYIPYEQSFEKSKQIRRASFFVRTAGGLDALPAIIRRMVAQMDSTVPVFAMRTMEQQVEESVFTERLVAALSTAFGVLAMLLTAVGLYGVIAYLVTRRTTEIGVRMALGATRSNIARMVLGEVVLVLCAGCAAGLAGAWLAGRGLESQLFGIGGFDPVVFVTAPVVLAVVALLATSLPALRASRIQPLEALRHE